MLQTPRLRVTLGRPLERKRAPVASVAMSDERACERRVEAVDYVLRFATPARKTRGQGPPQRITGSNT